MPEPFTHELEGISPKTITSGVGFPTTIMDGFVEQSPEQEPMIMSSDEMVPSSSSSSPPQDSPLDISPLDGDSPVSVSPPGNNYSSTNATAAPQASLHPHPAPRPRPQPPKPSLTRPIFRTAQGVESTKDLKTDFADMGMSKKKVGEVAGIKESRMPDGKTIHKRASPSGAAEGGGREKRVKRDSAVKGKEKGGKVEGEYEGLRVGGDPNWILFDPHPTNSHNSPSPFPPFHTTNNNATPNFRDPPRCFAQFETYKLGNKRILEYNLVTHSVRLKSTPEVLEGKEVLYSGSGPKIVNVMDLGPKRGLGRRGGRGSKGAVSQVEVEKVREEDEDMVVHVGKQGEGEEDDLYT
ncbi:hypothetical protein LTR78_001474 [Recurvomyces mirabilis]|uniref:Uncharacterized protein n=1 Tax=Recurvomyces mirabilis TaxID=574656 RepID=A0AAE1C5K5_9PEZI|nr:hypothetical protein LTR78_001474 [Recurvomyces mirabilis]KAK5161453.1 hypothetical protein LTS14_001249 [Recurvomyces mirabilis]